MIALFIIFLLFSIIIHEVSHGFIAYKLGDPTAKYADRLNLNPIVHIDIVGTIIVPLLLILSQSNILFGWAKPVPINPYNFKNPRKDMMWVGLSGPVSNIIIAMFLSILKIAVPFTGIRTVLNDVAFINIVLAVINLIPIPPLDGSRVLNGVLPRQISYKYMKLEPYGIFLVFIFIFTIGRYIIWPIIAILAGILNIKLPSLI